MDNAAKRQILCRMPTGCFGEAEEIPEVVALLIGEGTGRASGKLTAVDGVKVMQ